MRIGSSIIAFALSLSNKRTRQRVSAVRILAGPAPQPLDLVCPCEQPWTGGECPMWKRDESVKPATGSTGSTPAPAQHGSTPHAAEAAPTRPAPASEPQRGQERNVVNIGTSVVIKGELSGRRAVAVVRD